MAWDDVVRKYPWVVIDPSSLIGHSTPKKLEELVTARNPLYRQFYIGWLITNKGCPRSDGQLLQLFVDLNELNKKSSDATKRKKYDDAKEYFERTGPLAEYYTAIREIKDAVKERQKEDPNVRAGLLFATEVAVAAQGSAQPDETLVNAAANLQTGAEQAQLMEAFGEFRKDMREFFTKSGGGAHWQKVEPVLDRTWLNIGSWKANLRIQFARYQKALPYLQAAPDERAAMVRRAKTAGTDEMVDLYIEAESGALTTAVWATVSRYGQSLAAFGVAVSNTCETLVNFAKAQAESDMRRNFAAAFPDAALGLMAAKTAVGVASSIAAFFPPIGTAVASGLNLAMMIADNATQIILTKMAKEDPETVLNQFGKTFDAVPKEKRGELAEKLAEGGLTFLELAHTGAEIGHGAADIHTALQPLEEAARAAAEEGLKQAGQAVAGVGAVITVVSLAYDWYDYAETSKRELRNRTGLKDEDVERLKDGLENAYENKKANVIWTLRGAVFHGMDGKDYKVEINGVPGKIRGDTWIFAPDDRKQAYDRILEGARRQTGTGLAYNGGTFWVDWDAVQPGDIDETGESGALTIQAKLRRRSGDTFTGKLSVTVEGRTKLLGVDMPATSAELARMASNHGQLTGEGGEQYRLDWTTAKVVSDQALHFRCEVDADTGSRKTRVGVKVQRGGKPLLQVLDTGGTGNQGNASGAKSHGGDDSDDDVATSSGPVTANDRSRLRAKLLASASSK